MALQDQLDKYGIELRKTTDGRYVYGAPSAPGNPAQQGYLDEAYLKGQGIDVNSIKAFDPYGANSAAGDWASKYVRQGGTGELQSLLGSYQAQAENYAAEQKQLADAALANSKPVVQPTVTPEQQAYNDQLKTALQTGQQAAQLAPGVANPYASNPGALNTASLDPALAQFNQAVAQMPKPGPTTQAIPGVGTLTTIPKTTPQSSTSVQDPNLAGLSARTGVNLDAPLVSTPPQATNANNTVYKDANNNVFRNDGTPIDLATFKAMGLNIDHINLRQTGAAAAPQTPPQPTNANNGVYKDSNNNVFMADGTPIDLQTFKDMGLNIDHINLKPGVQNTTTGMIEASGANTAPVFGGTSGQVSSSAVTNAYQTLQDNLDKISQKLIASKTQSPEEQALAAKLNDAKAALAQFDTETLSRAEAYSGQGRGATLSSVAQNQSKDARTRALQRLGLAQDSENIINQLGLASSNRQQQGDIANIEMQVANAKLDAQLGLADKLQTMDEKQKADTRTYLLDVIDFAKGKSFDQLDPATQQAIVTATAHSPITLGMVKTAMTNGAAPQKLDTSVVEVNGVKKLINNQTGATIATLGSASSTPSSASALTTAQKTTLKAKGIPDNVVTAITGDILSGNSLEQIRQDLISVGLDPKILDTFDGVVSIQGLLDSSRTQYKTTDRSL